MINCFFWYTFIWLFILLLYPFNISNYNTPLDSNLLIFILVTSIISLILGLFFKKNFKFYVNENATVTEKAIKLLVCGYICEYIYSKNIPLISIVFFKNSYYGEFEGIPIFHVLLVGFSTYYYLKYFYCAICNKKKRKENLLNCGIILLLFLLTYYRSMIVINCFMSLLITLKYLSSKKTITAKHYGASFIALLLLCYCYGGIGNLRDGYKWNDNSYIEKLGLYHNFPEYIPKQFMWTYSYLTTPLANLNYNIKTLTPTSNINGLAYELLPATISKRIFSEIDNDSFVLIKTYFNAVTGWCNVYINYGYVGMYILYFTLILLTIICIHLLSFKKNKEKNIVLSSILCVVYIFMFFYNTLNYVGIALPFWIVFISLLPRLQFKKKKC